NPYLRVHSGINFVLLVDSFILLYLTSIFTSVLLLSPYDSVVLGLTAGTFTLVWLSYRRRVPWAYWIGAVIIALTGIFFAFFSLVNLLALFSGSSGSILFVLLFGWCALGSFRRSMTHLHPGYNSMYFGRDEEFGDIELEAGEMLAACPTCMAVLAIRPTMLRSSDRCPHCQNPLINERLAAKYEEE
ncbi:MAG: hypothetical protein CMA63_01980, partial [Euryarchaeota archaeon]|nr:hypothetical protein [Euryarchaeota archaeon]